MVICSYDKEENKWVPLKTNIDIKNNILEADIRAGAIIGIVKDTKNPIINNIVPRNNATYLASDLSDFNIKITDDFSGVNYQNGIDLILNDTLVLTGFNTYQKKIIANIRGELKAGINNYELIVYDNANNKSSIKGKFTIKEN